MPSTYGYLDNLVSRNYRQEVLLLVRTLRERKLRNFDKIYLSVGNASLSRADQHAKTFSAHSLRVHCVDADNSTGGAAWAAAPATGLDDKWSSNAGPSSAQDQQLTKEYVYWLVLSGGLDATIEEEAASSDEYTITFNHESSSTRGQDLTAQITRLHKLLNEVTTVAGVMSAAGREVVVPRSGGGGKGSRGGRNPGKGRAYYMGGEDYNDSKPIMTPSISFTDLQAVGNGGDDAAAAADQGFGFDHGVKPSFRHVVEDAADMETDTSGVDTIDED